LKATHAKFKSLSVKFKRNPPRIECIKKDWS